MAYQPFDLAGKVALITGGNRGIGLGMAMALAQAGARVAIWGRDRAKNLDAQAALSACTAMAKAYVVDVCDEFQIASAMEQVVGDFGRIDSVFANAGAVAEVAPFIETTTRSYRKTLAVNLDSVFWTAREACRHFTARAVAGDASGSFIAVSSIAALFGPPQRQAYAASKAALLSLVKSIAVEHAPYEVRANAIIPGFVRTDLTAAIADSHSERARMLNDQIVNRVPVRRWGTPEDFGGIAVYLASDASRFHTGDGILIDGGFMSA